MSNYFDLLLVMAPISSVKIHPSDSTVAINVVNLSPSFHHKQVCDNITTCDCYVIRSVLNVHFHCLSASVHTLNVLQFISLSCLNRPRRSCTVVYLLQFSLCRYSIFILWGGTRSLHMPALRPASQAGTLCNPREGTSVVLHDTIRLT